jgi:hypothetical protein
VDMIKYRESDYTIVAATHGRGCFTAKLSTPAPQTNGNVVAEQQLQTGQNNLRPNSTAYFYSSEDGQLICKIANNTSYDYGCTTVNVTRASNVSTTPIHFYTITDANDLLPKTIQVVPTNTLGSGNNYTLTMYFTAAEITAWQTHTGSTWAQANMVNCSGNITLVTPTTKTAGGTVTILPNTANTTVGLPQVSATFTTALGSYGVGTSTTFVLPIELLSFTGNFVDKSVPLNWRTANERNAKQFDVERSFDGKSFERIGIVKAKGNSTTPSDYTLTDYKPTKGVNYYRLRQVDLDEGVVLSKVIAVEVNAVQKLQVFPNPAHDKLSVVGDNLGDFTISDLSGRAILRGPLNGYETGIDVSKLPSGVYFLNANRSSVKFLKL